MSHIWLSQVTHIHASRVNESCHSHAFKCVAWCIDMRGIAFWCVWHVWHDSVIHLTCLVHMCDMSLSYVFTCVTWLRPVCGMTRSYGRHDSFTYVTWLNRMYEMTHLRDVTRLCVTNLYVWSTARIHMRAAYECGTSMMCKVVQKERQYIFISHCVYERATSRI